MFNCLINPIKLRLLHLISIALICIIPVLSIYGQTIVTGESNKILDNKKDIYHQKNKFAREKMIEEAVVDAIEKAAPETISITVGHNHFSSTDNQSFEEVFEEFVSKTLMEKHVEWQRTSSYKFARDETNKKKWFCIVEGEIRNLDSQSTITETSEGDKTTSNSLNNFITRKSYNIVHLNAGIKRGVIRGDKFVAYRDKRKKTSFGENWIHKKKGLIVITETSDNFSVGRIVKGVFTTRESQQAAKVDFRTLRVGFEYQLSGSHEQVNEELDLFSSNDTTALVNSITHTIYFFHYGMQSRTGYKLGLEVFNCKIDTTGSMNYTYTNCFVPKIHFNLGIGLIPDFLYIKPGVSIGYLFENNENREELFGKPDNRWGADVVLEAGIAAHLQLWHFDLMGGITYKYINDLPNLTNYYPYVGLSYNLARYAKYNFKVK